MKKTILALLLTCITVACVPRGFAPPPSDDEAFTNKNRPNMNQVREALNDCGDNQAKKNNETQTNADARVIECMFAKGFYFKSGWGGPCSADEYRSKLPACLNAPIRPRQGYYGQ